MTKRSGGHVYFLVRRKGHIFFVIRKNAKWCWLPVVRSNPMHRLAIWWFGLYLGFERPWDF